MYCTIYQATNEAISRWRRQFPPAAWQVVAPATPGAWIGLYDQSECLDILKFIFPNVAIWLDYDLLPINIAVGKVE